MSKYDGEAEGAAFAASFGEGASSACGDDPESVGCTFELCKVAGSVNAPGIGEDDCGEGVRSPLGFVCEMEKNVVEVGEAAPYGP